MVEEIRDRLAAGEARKRLRGRGDRQSGGRLEQRLERLQRPADDRLLRPSSSSFRASVLTFAIAGSSSFAITVWS